MTILNLETKFDPECVDSLRALRQVKSRLNESQNVAVPSVLVNIGDCRVGSSSMSLIQGPPGTGKTSCIPALIGALVHHSQAGHIGVKGHEQKNALKGKRQLDDILRRSSNKSGLTILIACSSNTATDNVMCRMRKYAILGKDGKRIYPEMARVARQRYDYGPLEDVSLNTRALPYDHLFLKPGAQRRNASKAASQKFAGECIILFTTLTTCGSSHLRDLKFAPGVTIIDEAGPPQEPESLIPLVATICSAYNRRSHQVLRGDHRQLTSPGLCSQLMMEHKLYLTFDYKLQIKSLFERMHKHRRASSVMLTEQYRSHLSISALHSCFFYEDKVKSPLDKGSFRTEYNQGRSVNGGYAPFTCIDTSKCEDRIERREECEKYYNLFEKLK